MKMSTMFFFIFICGYCLGQNENPLLNHVLSPVETEIIFDFGEGLMKDTDFDLDFSRMILLPLNKDTTLEMGTKKYSVTLPLEKPTLLRLHIANQWDHLFVLPGEKTYAIYNPLKDNQDRIDVVSPQSLIGINEYYDAKYKLLEVSRAIMQSYWVYNDMYVNPILAKEKYDSLAEKQYNILSTYTGNLPAWFIEFEKKSIKYMTATFKLSAIGRKNLDLKRHFVDDYSSFEISYDLNDTIGVLTKFYFWALRNLSFLTYCGQDCFDDLEIRLPAMYKASLAFSEVIQNPLVKQLFLANNMIAAYSGSHTIPDNIVQSFENKLDKPYLDMVSIYKNPPLKGQKAPSFYLSDPDGKFHTLKDLKGQVILLNFWFVGCKPCEMELPYEKELVRELQGNDFQLVNICTNTPDKVWKEFIMAHDMPGLNLYAKGNWGSKLADDYQFSSYPTYILIDMEGKIAMDKAPRPSGEQLIKEIRQRLD